MKRAIFVLAFGSVLSVSTHAAPLLSEGFNNISTLGTSGWFLDNYSSPAGITDWFQGNDGIFVAQSGPDDSYIASNFEAAEAGGFIQNMLTTPTFSLATDAILSFWARGAADPDYSDNFAVWFGKTVGTAPEEVSQVLADTVALGDWTHYTINISGQGAGSIGRFAFEYFGEADTSNYFGLDTVSVNSVEQNAVPEPSTIALFGIGVLGLLRQRRKSCDAIS